MSNGKKVIHLNKFNQGRSTPAEFFRQHMYANLKCSMCGDPPAMRIRLLAPVDEFKKKYPREYNQLMLLIGGNPTFPTKYGPMLHIQSIFACDLCKVAARRFAAQKEDWVIAEFEEMGLEEKHPLLIQVPGL